MKKKFYFITFSLFFLVLSTVSYGQIKNLFNDISKNQLDGLKNDTRTYVNTLQSAKLVSVNGIQNSFLYANQGFYQVILPTNAGELTLDIYPGTVLGPEFKVTDAEGKTIPVELPAFYWGKIADIDSSFVTLTVYSDGISGIVSSRNYNYTIGKLAGSKENLHIIYETNEIPNNRPFETEEPDDITIDTKDFMQNPNEGKGTDEAVTGCRAVQVYVEADYATFQSHGSNSANVINFTTNIFNNVSALYANEGVNLVLHSLKIWTTADPYAPGSNSSSDILSSFQSTHTNAGFSNFPATANLAHLISTRNAGGGVAFYAIGTPVYAGMEYISVLRNCNKNLAFGFSGTMDTSIVNIPSYSWNVMVVTHELGHNLGLPHTHNCIWPGGAIDGCYSLQNGPCTSGGIPPEGGTIMSYCHLKSVGINLSLGFGPMPGDKLRAEVAAATCLGGTPSIVPIASNQSRCNAGSLTLTASGCPGTYRWYTVSTGGTAVSTSSSYTTPSLSATKSYYVDCTSPANCTSKRKEVLAIIEASLPTTIGAAGCGSNVTITLNATGCTGTYNWYSTPSGGTSLGTGNTFTTPPISVTTDYYVSCTKSGCTSARAKATASVSSEPCYCTPPSQDCSDGDVITLVKITEGETVLLNNPTGCSINGYSQYSTSVNLIIGNNYALTVNNPGIWNQGIKAWIDFNRNGSFESGEVIFLKYGNQWTTDTQSFTVSVSGIPSGPTWMRVRTVYGGIPDVCTNYNDFGETEDYLINLVGLPCPPTLTLVHPTDSYSSGIISKTASSATGGKINASNRVTGTAKVTYEARAIELTPGFRADSGTVFKAQPGGCP